MSLNQAPNHQKSYHQTVLLAQNGQIGIYRRQHWVVTALISAERMQRWQYWHMTVLTNDIDGTEWWDYWKGDSTEVWQKTALGVWQNWFVIKACVSMSSMSQCHCNQHLVVTVNTSGCQCHQYLYDTAINQWIPLSSVNEYHCYQSTDVTEVSC